MANMTNFSVVNTIHTVQ